MPQRNRKVPPKRTISDGITKGQQKLIKELDQICFVLGKDYWNILRFEKDARIPILHSQRKQIICGEIISQYTLMEELLNMRIRRVFIPNKPKSKQPWKRKTLKVFNHYVLEKLSIRHKLDLYKQIDTIPKEISGILEKMISLRNGVAHSFFPEDLKGNRAEYKGKNIFSLDGITQFNEDMNSVFSFLIGK